MRVAQQRRSGTTARQVPRQDRRQVGERDREERAHEVPAVAQARTEYTAVTPPIIATGTNGARSSATAMTSTESISVNTSAGRFSMQRRHDERRQRQRHRELGQARHADHATSRPARPRRQHA